MNTVETTGSASPTQLTARLKKENLHRQRLTSVRQNYPSKIAALPTPSK